MSGVKRTQDYHSLKTRTLILQNPDNTFPQGGGVLQITTTHGTVTSTRDVAAEQLLINGTPLIDASASIVARTMILTSTDTAIQAEGDVRITNANIYNSGDQNTTGTVQTTVLSLLDLSSNPQESQLYVQDGEYFWQRDANPQLTNISAGLDKLRVDPLDPQFSLLGLNDISGARITLNRLTQLFSDRNAFLKRSDLP